MIEAPAVRGSVSKSALQAIEGLPPDLRKRVLDHLRPSSLETIQQTLGVGWVPMDDHYELFVSTAAVLPPSEFKELWRQITLLSYKQPILKAVWESAIRLFGFTPHSLLKGAPQVWKLVTSKVGELSYDPAPTGNQARLHWRAIPQKFVQTGVFPEGMAGAYTAFFSLTNTTGTVTIKSIDREKGSVVYLFSWK